MPGSVYILAFLFPQGMYRDKTSRPEGDQRINDPLRKRYCIILPRHNLFTIKFFLLLIFNENILKTGLF